MTLVVVTYFCLLYEADISLMLVLVVWSVSTFSLPFLFLLVISYIVLSIQVMRPNHGDEYTFTELNPVEWTFDTSPQVDLYSLLLTIH